MPRLQIEGVNKHFGSFTALNDIWLDIPAGKLLCLLGPSGCGKTTILRIIAGLEFPDSGKVLLDGNDLAILPPHRRDIGMVFQSHALFPHLSVAENISYGLRIAGNSKNDRLERVKELLETIRLPDAGGKRINQLSGGELQRVSIARALARQPRIFLLDEPTSALDANLRETMQIELRRLQQSLNITTVVVTHDQSEAMTLADLIVVMQAGTIEQIGPPMEIYEKPRTEFVANFIGATNMLNCIWDGNCAVLGNNKLNIKSIADSTLTRGDPVKVSIRPERVELLAANRGKKPDSNQLTGTVEFVRNIGNLVEIHTRCENTSIAHTYSPQNLSTELNLREGDAVIVHLPAEHCLLYSK